MSARHPRDVDPRQQLLADALEGDEGLHQQHHLHLEVQELVEGGTLTAGHAKALLGLQSPEEQLRIGKMVVAGTLSVRETEKLVDLSLVGKKRQPKGLHSSPWVDLETRLQKRLGTKVTIHPHKQGGKIAIHYFSPDELDGIVDTLLS